MRSLRDELGLDGETAQLVFDAMVRRHPKICPHCGEPIGGGE